MKNKYYLNNLTRFCVAVCALSIGFSALNYAHAQDKNPKNSVAETNATTTSSKPIEIEADDALEWDRVNKTYTAQGNAIATQGDTRVIAETLIADYRESDESNTEIWRLTAKTAVQLQSPEGTAFGDQAIYIIDDARAEMTGRDLRLESPDQVITATRRFDYYTDENRFEAHGDVVVKRAEDTLKADRVMSLFKNAADGSRKLDKMEAHGKVVIITPEETLKGRVGTYDPDTEIAELIGNVTILRGPNILKGTRAIVDLKTNISRVYGSPKAGQRVKGIFFPENNDSNVKNGVKAPATSSNAPPRT